MNKALENARNAGVFKKAQDTELTLSVSEDKDAAFLARRGPGRSVHRVQGDRHHRRQWRVSRSEDCLIPCTIAVKVSEAPKCPRCWNH